MNYPNTLKHFLPSFELKDLSFHDLNENIFHRNGDSDMLVYIQSGNGIIKTMFRKIFIIKKFELSHTFFA